MASINHHPNVLKVIAYGIGQVKICSNMNNNVDCNATFCFETMQVGYIVTELAEDFDLRQVLFGNPFSEIEALHILSMIVDGLL